MNFLLKSRRVLLSSAHPVESLALEIEGERIKTVYPVGQEPAALPCHDLGEALVMPGIVDSHAHINEPGRTDWEGFETATRAAAAGGITTVVDMPLNSIPPTTTVKNLEAKSRAALGLCSVDYALWGGVIPGNAGELAAMAARGVPGFKAFLCESGVEEFPQSTEEDLRLAMRELAKVDRPLLAHAELCQIPAQTPEHTRRYAEYVRSRPPEWEIEAIRLLIRLARETGCAVHIVHLSAAGALADIAQAKKSGVRLTVETCPHYLTLEQESIPEGATHFKCAPPIRDHRNRERLWNGLLDDNIDLIVSDHSPCTPELKKMEAGDFMGAWGGIAGLELSARAVWTEMRERHLPLQQLIKWMCEGPARLAGLSHRKGSLSIGKDADLMVWHPDRPFRVDATELHHRHPITPFAEKELYGVVARTYLRGQLIFSDGTFAVKPIGQELKRI